MKKLNLKIDHTALSSNSGFSLIELSIVLIVAAIAVSLTIPGYQKSIEQARSAEAIGGIFAIRDAESTYKVNYGIYTSSSTIIDQSGLHSADGSSYYWYYGVARDSGNPNFLTVYAVRTSKKAPAGAAGMTIVCDFYDPCKRVWRGSYTDLLPKD